MLVAVIADGIAMAFSENSIMTEKLARRGLRIHSEYEPDVLRRVMVSEAMIKDPPKVPTTMPVREMAERLAQHDPVLWRHHGVLIVDEAGKLQGIITRGDLLRAMEADPTGTMTVLEAGTPNPLVAYTDELLFHAANRMVGSNVGRLPVVDRQRPGEAVGYLGRSGILSARLRQIEEEQLREPGWMKTAVLRRRVAKPAAPAE
jgi:CBS domain-containing protein